MKIKEFCTIRMGYAFRKRLEHVPGGGVKVIQPKNISAGGILSFEDDEPWNSSVSSSNPLQPGDVLLVNRGRFAATVFNLHDPGPWIVPSSILILSIKNESVLPEYVTLFFNSANGQKLFRRHFEKTTVPFISRSNLENMDIPVPSIEKQSALVDFEKTHSEYAQLLDRKLELHKQILSHELTKAEKSISRRNP
jgi:restriction endonuclease S subunit